MNLLPPPSDELEGWESKDLSAAEIAIKQQESDKYWADKRSQQETEKQIQQKQISQFNGILHEIAIDTIDGNKIEEERIKTLQQSDEVWR